MPDEFVIVPAGWFLMGSEGGQADEAPVHRVWVDAFEMGRCAVTRGQYARFLAATAHEAPREWDNTLFGDPDAPVVGVSWHDAVAYCAWRSTTERAVRLPTEAEWERAARGGREGLAYPDGDEPPAWLPAGGRGPVAAPWPVRLGDPNGFGLYGIGANVHEWCADWHASDYYAISPDRNPQGPASGARRASRGGSWRHAVTISRTAARSRLDPSFRYTDYGFRLARSL
ncbi:MAG: SUMF1/EgtB/PvdO family nonheme iron enzyme [Acidobacteriota bacterium]|nr:SUMF1/EgtB/PvdO family nonheme iron enzyme [Acidobacteriota bacterium]